MGKTKAKSQADIDWEDRTLCIDESCIGVIGPNGKCRECGKIFEGYKKEENHKVQTESKTDTPSDEEEPLHVKEEMSSQPDDETGSQADIDWENRMLCSDESCIGVIGPDGRCKECGKVFKK